MVRDLLQRWSPNTLRLFLGNHHYREVWSYDEAELETAEKLEREISQALSIDGGKGAYFDAQLYWNDFTKAMDNDLDTPTALLVIHELAKAILISSKDGYDLREAKEILGKMVNIFGFAFPPGHQEPRVVEGWKKHLVRFI